MVDRLTGLLYGLLIFVFLSFAGCTPPTTTQLKTSPASQQANRGKGSGQKNATRETRKPPSSSSLEALRRGQSLATSPSSPLKDIRFNFDRYDLRADAREILKANARWIKANPSARVEIEGHCDDRGTNEYNLALGAQRAQAAKNYLVSLGISVKRLSTISYGEELPLCREHSESCWQKNRRDRFVIIPTRPAS
ncbi:MAG: peptidoglycan-associated lipoprotein Pal [Candidatus Binatia bacterium]